MGLNHLQEKNLLEFVFWHPTLHAAEDGMAEAASGCAIPHSPQKACCKQAFPPQTLLCWRLHPKVQHQAENWLILPKCSIPGAPLFAQGMVLCRNLYFLK